MFLIRNDQMHVFSLLARDRYIAMLAEHLVEMFPHRSETIDRLRELAGAALDRAANYGIVSERDVATFAELMMAFGPRFELEPEGKWAMGVLTKPGLSGPARAVILRVLARDKVDPEDADVFASDDVEEEAEA